MNIYCREHGRSLGIVRLHRGAWPELVSRSPRWRDRHSVAVGHPEEPGNSFSNLSLWGRPEIEAKGCRECGPRMLEVETIVRAFEEGRSKIHL